MRFGGRQVHCRWVHLDASWGSSRSDGAIGFILGCSCFRWVHSGSLGSSRCTLGVVEVVWFIRMHPAGRRVHSGSLGSSGCALGVVRFSWGRWVHPGAPTGSSGLFGVVR